MSTFLRAAEQVLERHGRPMHPRELARIAVDEGDLLSEGKTPENTMKARLSDDILARRDDSAFMRTAPNVFALRKWDDVLVEFHAERFSKSPLEEDAVVFDIGLIDSIIKQPGFNHEPLVTGSELLSHCRPLLREDAERDTEVVQLVSSFVLEFEGRYLTFQRSGRLPEKRLKGQYSLNFGGHVTPEDLSRTGSLAEAASSLIDPFDPRDGYVALARELVEEVALSYVPACQYLGLIYDDRREVSRQHLAIVYKAQLRGAEYTVAERGNFLNSKFETLGEIDARIEDFENWSELIYTHEREALG
ncbi:hypothetical protein Acsp06_54080 [Actinomycetospora sp. NBRC 106375]|uniref:HTH domain-containing protein n=1 Tax=Actinomycetospora sp. NBRC 106375 TaxID=3032207 RepID=UPI0024A599AE|nr:HTH domain-containing protein [Actinomycetospora sp. NBRC 106375]GLZ49223.1 hypothetical protein Acsp06_54080 [Actinomycetospora sp. NBRC 106375]